MTIIGQYAFFDSNANDVYCYPTVSSLQVEENLFGNLLAFRVASFSFWVAEINSSLAFWVVDSSFWVVRQMRAMN